MVATTTTERLQAALSDADFPADKDRLLEFARANGADDETVRALRALPVAEYENFEQVAASVAKTDAGGPTDDADKANARRHHTHPQMAEREKDIPSNPIVEELGENRGS
ncbi:hypothetical protein F4561_005359 [Lipingzhangella halophila]|uniref:DUF2795 domain-containing protein n=1 Tax=Lipingzhangella halophila TaxID=1783352 RepID=A0A7W7RM74_9ACTN|nr:DUF2795 domain-containing protein [Lipingzhangella halophila]MBB4934539.1 hypothetical protein [Lipingzhangella halophila]